MKARCSLSLSMLTHLREDLHLDDFLLLLLVVVRALILMVEVVLLLMLRVVVRLHVVLRAVAELHPWLWDKSEIYKGLGHFLLNSDDV